MLELGFQHLESEPGCFVKKGVTHNDTIIVVVRVETGENVEAQAYRVH